MNTDLPAWPAILGAFVVSRDVVYRKISVVTLTNLVMHYGAIVSDPLVANNLGNPYATRTSLAGPTG